mmetsp:Transcript_10545/g.39228  ORF Transcript_10545/g.39228 Transcript_10545/m.39228 type:complete len:92 (-) Transcript_10545:330-605(-)
MSCVCERRLPDGHEQHSSQENLLVYRGELSENSRHSHPFIKLLSIRFLILNEDGLIQAYTHAHRTIRKQQSTRTAPAATKPNSGKNVEVRV